MLRLFFQKFSKPLKSQFRFNTGYLFYFSTNEAPIINSNFTTDFSVSPTRAGATPKKYTEEFFTNQRLNDMVSVYLKSLQLTQSYELSKQKFSASKSSIPILNSEEIKKSLYNLLQDKEIKRSSIDEMINLTQKHYQSIQSFEIELDEKYYIELVEYFQQLAKFFMRNNIYTIEHNVDIESSLAQEILSKLYNVQFIIESLNLKELTEVQLVKIFPAILMIVSVYDTSESIIENYTNELKTRIFNPFKPDEEKKTHLKQLELFLRFLIANDFISNPEAYYNFLILYKEIILRSSNINDLLYVLTNNIYRYATLEPENRVDKMGFLFSEFMQSYLNSLPLIESTIVNHDLFKRFIASLMLLKEEDMSLDMIKDLRMFIIEGVMPLPSMSEFLKKSNTLELMLDLDSKIFDRNNLPLNFNLDKSLVTTITDEKRLLSMIIKIGMYNKEDRRNLLGALTHNLHQNLDLLKNQSIEDIVSILKSLSRYKLKTELSLFYKSIKEGLYNNLTKIDLSTHVDLLYCLCKSNLIHAYDSNPVYLSLLLKLKHEHIDNINIIWTLAYMTLRTKEFNPVTKYALWEVKNVIERNGEDSLTTEAIGNILEIVAMTELFMKYQLTKEDYDKYFHFDFVSNLKKLYHSRTSDKFYTKQLEFHALLMENYLLTTDAESNLYHVDKILCVDKDYVPVIFINEDDFNLNDRVLPEVYIKYHHLYEYFKTKPILLDLNKVRNTKEFDKQVELYKKEDGYKKYFD